MNFKKQLINFMNKYTLLVVIIIIIAIYFFFTIYMRNIKKQVIVFDLDETLGCFVELGAFCDTIEKYNRKKLNFEEFYKIMELYPEFLRPNILKILNYLKEKKEEGNIYKVFVYTNNQGPKEWAQRIIMYLERKLTKTKRISTRKLTLYLFNLIICLGISGEHFVFC